MSTPTNFTSSDESQKHNPLGRLSDAVKALNTALTPRYLGLGFVWAWIYCSFQTPTLFPNGEGVSINADISWIASALAVVISLFAFGALWQKRNLRSLTAFHWAAGILVGVGTIISMLCAVYFPALDFVSVVGGILSGLGSGLLCIFWADVMTQLDIEHIEVMVPSAFGITLLCILIVPAIQGFIGVLVIAALPVISSLFLRSAYRDSVVQPDETSNTNTGSALSTNTSSRSRSHLSESLRLTLIRSGLTVCIFYTAIGFSDGISILVGNNISHLGFDLPAFIGSLCGLAMALGFVLFTIRVDFQSLFRWLTPLIVLMLTLITWSSPTAQILSEVIGAVADTIMQVIVYVYIISLARRRIISAALGIGIVQGFVQLGVLVGNIAGERAAFFIPQTYNGLFTVVLLLICIVVFATLIVPQRTQAAGSLPLDESADQRSVSETAISLAERSQSGQTLEAENSHPSLTYGKSPEEASPQTNLSRCAELAQRYDLSRREAEILEYLAKGRSQPYIREELMLSKNTVATHVKHIYQKLNVHSKQELIDLVEGERAGQ